MLEGEDTWIKNKINSLKINRKCICDICNAVI